MSGDLNLEVLDRGMLQGSERPRRQLRGITLFAAILDELVTQLGKDIPTSELMSAAQSLIELSKRDYVAKAEPERRHPTFYSMDVRAAFDTYAWKIAVDDTPRLDHCDIDEYSPESYQAAKLVLQGHDERLWEF